MRSAILRVVLFVMLATLGRPWTALPAEEGNVPAAGAPEWKPPEQYPVDTPRGSMGRFIRHCRNLQYPRAAEYLNLSAIPRASRSLKGPELARQLETVLDRALWVDLDNLPDRPEGDPDDGLPGSRDSLGEIETINGPVEVLIERLSQPTGPVWKFTASTVAVIPALYEEFGWGSLGHMLPAVFFEARFLRIRLWQWIGLVVLGAAAWLASWVFRRLVGAAVRRVAKRRPDVDRQLIQYTAGPLGLLVGVAGFALGLDFLGLAIPVHRGFVAAEKGIALGAATWVAVRWLDVIAARIERRFATGRHSRAMGTVPFGSRTLKIFVAVTALVAALQNFGFNVTGIIAGLGIGGLAIALAAQKTVENLFGSVSLVADQPVRVGDVCRFGDTVGRVEDIGLRSTRLRTIDQTLVTIPNAHFSTLALENLSRRDRIPVRATVTLPQGTSAERVETVLAGLCEMILAQPKVDADSARAQFVRMDAKQLEIELFAYVRTAQWDEFVKIRQQIFLRALQVVGESGSAFG